MKTKNIIVLSVFVLILVISGWATPEHLNPAKHGAWYSILPPLLAITLALLTENIMLSLVSSVLVGGVLSAVLGSTVTLKMFGKELGTTSDGLTAGPIFVLNSATDITNLQILVFIVVILAIIALLVTSGALQGVVNWLARSAKNARSTQFATALMGVAVFIDDYANTMLVGNSMRPLTDKYKVSREKLAFLVDATAAPIAGVAFISTWIGYQVGLFAEQSKTLGLGRDGYAMFFDSMGFRFYCLFMLFYVFFNIWSQREFGPMAEAEKRARAGKVLADDAVPLTSKALTNSKPARGVLIRASAALISFGTLVLCLLVGLWLDGGGGARFSASPLSIFNPMAWRDVLSAAENGILILAQSAGIGLLVATLSAVFISRLSLRLSFQAILKGLKGSLLPCVILILAWSLKAACDSLNTGPFVVATIGQVLSPIWFPTLIFGVAFFTAFSTGTSWGTMAILIPIVTPIAFQLDGSAYGLVTMITLGSILDGAIFGDHCSPISDTTIMSSIGSSSDHIHHVRTQLPYAVLVGAIAILCGYIPAAMGVPSWICLIFGAGILAWLHLVLSRKHGVIAG